MEKFQINKRLRDQRMKLNLSQARRENHFLIDRFEKSKIINKMKTKRVISI